MEEFGGIPLHEAMISHGMFPLIVFMLFANMAIILAIKCASDHLYHRLRWKLPSQKDAYDLRQDFQANDD